MEEGWRGGPMAAASRRGSVARRGGGMMSCGSGDNVDVLVAGARSGGGRGGGTEVCGSGDGGWTPSWAFREQPLERDETLSFPK